MSVRGSPALGGTGAGGYGGAPSERPARLVPQGWASAAGSPLLLMWGQTLLLDPMPLWF